MAADTSHSGRPTNNILSLCDVSKNQLSTNQNLLNARANSRKDRWICIIPLDMYCLAQSGIVYPITRHIQKYNPSHISCNKWLLKYFSKSIQISKQTITVKRSWKCSIFRIKALTSVYLHQRQSSLLSLGQLSNLIDEESSFNVISCAMT